MIFVGVSKMIGEKGNVFVNKDDRGSLKALNDIPFRVRRSFIITDVPFNKMRGDHASKTSSFLYWMLNGSCKVELDDGDKKEVYTLNENETLFFSHLVFCLIMFITQMIISLSMRILLRYWREKNV